MINGLQIDADNIGKGLYQMAVEHGDAAIIAFGMLPAPLMQRTEKMLSEKLEGLYVKQNPGLPIDKGYIKTLTASTMREVASAIFRAAKNANQMIA